MTRLSKTTVGRKVIMGFTGAVLTLFVIGHVLGNLLVFSGRKKLNGYSALLHASSELLWSARVILLASVLLHVWAAWSLTRAARADRPTRYAMVVPQSATWASRTMRWGGVLIAVFIVVHLLHLTTGTIRPAPFSETDVYANVVGSFRVPWIATFYLVAMVALGLHLFHGVWAAFRSTGVSRPTAHPKRRTLATIVAVGVWAGFTAIPLGVLTGIVR